LLAFPSLASAATLPGLDSPEPVGAYFNGVFPSTPPGDPSGWAVVNAFPNLTFTDPMMLAEIPGTNDLLVVGKTGLMWRFPNDPAATMGQRIQVLDWTAATETSEDQGFYSLSFHPNFGQAGQTGEHSVYVCYNRRAFAGVDDNDRTYWTVSRFTWLPASGTLDPASEQVLISQYDPHRYHNGGATFFGDDGFLYITVGDGGDGGDSFDNSQKINLGFFGGILRIDVDNDPAKSHPIRRQPTENPLWEMNPKPAEWPVSYSQGYGIPNDNPWLDPNGGLLEEFYAIGLRSPHSAHFDPDTGDIWVGDVGQSNREELSRVRKGDNLQWAYKEGTRNTSKSKPTPYIGNETAPVHEYDHSVGASVIGGMRYRGSKWNAFLGGKVIFGDHVRGRIWSLDLSGSGSPVVSELYSSFRTGYKAGLANFSTDSGGEIYMMDLGGSGNATGRIMKLAVPALSAEPPQFLSQTGIFTNMATLATAPGVIPYDVPNPLWSDDAHKMRWLIVPNDGSHDTPAEDIVFNAEGNWVFPAGTVIVKHFEAPIDANNPAAVKRLETRFLVCTTGGGKYGFTYKWNETGTDAELMETGLEENYDYDTGSGTEPRTWTYPSRGDCMVCHNDVAGQALGVRTVHLNSPAFYPATGRTANQLETLDVSLTAAQIEDFIEARPLEDETAPLEHRIRSYLDTNCSHCHQPGAQGGGFDARLDTALDLQNLINAIPTRYEDLGPDGRYIKPGDTSLSAIHVRTAAVGNGDAMPPIAKNLAHGQGIAALSTYIQDLVPSEFDVTAAPTARYVRLTSLTGRRRYAAVGEFTILDGKGVAIPHTSITATADNEHSAGTPASEANDGNPGSGSNFWQTSSLPSSSTAPNHPHWLMMDLGTVREVGGFIYYPRPTSSDGRIYQYKVEYSDDAVNWTLFDSGTWPDSPASYRYDPLYNKRATRVQIAGPQEPVMGPFDVTVTFDMDVADFAAGDLQVTGGTVAKLRGSGYYYVARIWPTPGATAAQVSVGANAVNPQGKGSLASATLPLVLIPDTAAPETPGNLTAVPFVTEVELSWTAAGDNVAVENYEVWRNGIQIATVEGTTFTDSNLDPETAYTYEVTAVDAADNHSLPAAVNATTAADTVAPEMPPGLAATPALNSVSLSWGAAYDEVAIQEYRVLRGSDVIATVTGLSYNDTGLTDGTSYTYRVIAIDTSLNLSAEAVVEVTTLSDTSPPDAPGDFIATPGVTTVQLAWSVPWDNVGVTHYRIFRGIDEIATVTGTGYLDTGLEPETLYQYEVRALDFRGNISAAALAAATTAADVDPPTTPQDFTGVAGADSVLLSWSAATDPGDGSGVDRYRVKRDGNIIATVTSLGFHDTGLESGITYAYELVAIDEADNESAPALLSISTGDTSPPDMPGGLEAHADCFSVSLIWTAATDDVGVTGYEIVRVGAAQPLGIVAGLGFTDSGLASETEYTYEVRAVDAAGNKSAAATVVVTTLGFAEWLDELGLAGQTDADSDGGGLDNFAEFELGFDPLDPQDDLTFRLECATADGVSTITFPELRPRGHYHLHASSSLEDIAAPAHRILTITRAQVEAIPEPARSGHTVEVPASGERTFYVLVFEPAGP
jgi:uncharacterized repeat protein (TIGR03806 family)